MLTKWVIFIKAHEFILVMLAIIGTALYLGIKYENNQHDQITAGSALAVVQDQLKTQVTENQKLTGQLADQQAAYLKLAAQIREQNTEIDVEMATKNAQLAAQQKTDSTLPLTGIAQRWQALENLTPVDVEASGDHLSISGQGASKTVQDLETVPTLQNEVLGSRQVQENLTNQLAALGSVSDSQTKEIAGLDSQLTLAAKTCQDQIVLVKQQQKKKSSLWFKVGAVVGTVLTGLILR